MGKRKKIIIKLLYRIENREEDLRKVINLINKKLITLNLLIAKLNVKG